MENKSTPLKTLQALKISLEIDKNNLIENIIKSKWISYNEALSIVEEWWKDNIDFKNWYNCWCLIGYLSAINDAINIVNENKL